MFKGNSGRQSQVEFGCQDSCLFHIPHGKHLAESKMSSILRQNIILDAAKKEENCYL